MSWPMVVRTCLFDELLMRKVRDPGLGVVLDLAAGLDARPWRLDLPASLRWVDVDLPEILEHKRALMTNESTACRYQAEALDLRDSGARRERLASMAHGGAPGMVLCEGLLVYLESDEVAALARDLSGVDELRWWVIDLASPALLRWMEHSWGRATASGGAPFRFAPAEGTRFFEAHGWKEVEFRSTWEEAKRLRREMPMAWLWRLLGVFASRSQREQWRRFSGTVLLERI
jgi:O-methyltransferase involved in polyketide biosynthesis